MNQETKPPEGVEKGTGEFSPRALRLSATLRRAQELHPQRIDLKRFEDDETYRLATVIYGKDMVKLTEIPAEVLAQIVMRALGHVNSKCEHHLRVPTKTLEEAQLVDARNDSQPELPEGVLREEIKVFASFYPREFNPVVPPSIIPGLEGYVGAMVVIANTGNYMWIPNSNRLVEITPEFLRPLFERDRFIGWFMLWGLKEFVGSLVREVNRQLWLVTPLQVEIDNVIGRIAVR
ncbi:MAG: hypothetical protein RLY66_368 [Candidatus Parcubacteria bacterium]|jgi:hypothetical protein